MRAFSAAAGLPGDLESNAANYDAEGALKVDEELLPLNVPIHKGMDVFLTKNVRKDVDFVNGMLAEVVTYNPATKRLGGGLAVVGSGASRRSQLLPRLLQHYPEATRRGVGAHLHLPRCTRVPGAAHTAISRVRTGKDFLVGGLVTDLHFTPGR